MVFSSRIFRNFDLGIEWFLRWKAVELKSFRCIVSRLERVIICKRIVSRQYLKQARDNYSQRASRSYTNEGVLHITLSIRTRASPSDGLVSYPVHFLGGVDFILQQWCSTNPLSTNPLSTNPLSTNPLSKTFCSMEFSNYAFYFIGNFLEKFSRILAFIYFSYSLNSILLRLALWRM